METGSVKRTLAVVAFEIAILPVGSTLFAGWRDKKTVTARRAITAS